MKKLISVFGPSECKPGDTLYQQAEELGRELAQRHFIVVTGGYEGVMEAAAKGAVESGGGCVGVIAEVYSARGREPNAYISKEVKVKSAIDQLMELLDLADGYVAVGCSPGTLLEVVAAWDLTKKNFFTPKPLILLGEGWEQFDRLFGTSTYFESYKQIARYVRTVDEVIDTLESRLGKQLDLPSLNVINQG